MFNIKLSYAKNLAAFCDKNRMNLTRILIKPHPERGVYLCATNAHILGLYYDEEGSASDEYLLRVRDAPYLARDDKLQISRIEYEDGADNITVDDATFSLAGAVVKHRDDLHGMFPDFKRVINAIPEKIEVWNDHMFGLNPELFVPFRKIGKLRLQMGPTNKDPISIVSQDGNFFGMIMGMLCDDFKRPSWLKLED